MESSSTGIGRLDCYEDMFKEITRKLYGEDPDHRTSSVQNEFETSVSYKNEEDTGNGTDCSEDGKWTLDDEPLEGTEGSRIAAYRAATSTWRCYECGDCMGGGPREVAEHFVELHSSRIIGEESSRGRLHSSRKDYLSSGDLKLEDVVTYLERVRDRAERLAPPTRRTQETQTVPAALLPVSSTFLLQELPTSPPQHLHQNSASIPGNTTSSGGGGGGGGGNSGGSTGGGGGGGVGGNNASGKRYTCLYCPYGTDRRDLYTRHENIHREEKPFHCYVCYKPFSRADHVKKHFLRMHREHTYELSRIRRPAGSTSSTPKPPSSVQSTDSNANSNLTLSSNNSSNNNTQNSASPYPVNSIYSSPKQQQQQQQPLPISTSSTYQLQPQAVNNVHATSAALYQAATLAAAAAANVSNIMQQQQQQPDANCSTVPLPVVVPQTNPSVRRLSNGGCNTKSPHKSGSGGSSKANQERRYTCCYCSWSGVDNWCLKRHLNTHLKPFACALCEYKAARAERLATHVLKVHNRRQCSRCSFLAEDLIQLQVHQLHVHRVSNASVAAAAAAAASATAQGNAQQNQSNERQQQSHQPQPIHPVGGGRPPPGPPVFPASSAAIAPATTVIPPTTILGNRSEIASMPDSPCSVQESSSCEERFRLANHEHRRSRKQSMPRKIMTPIDNDAEIEISDEETETMHHQQESNSGSTSTKDSTPRPLLRCFLCPLEAPARAYRTRPYHTRESLMLHKLWRHTKQLSKRTGKENRSPAPAATAAASLTLKATLVTGRVFRYQR